MNKIISLLIISILMLGSMQVNALTPTDSNRSPGVIKSSSIFYFLDIWFDNIKVSISRDKEKARLEVARERLAEIETATTVKGRTKAIESVETQIQGIRTIEVKEEIITIGNEMITDDIDYEREKQEVIKLVNNDRWAKRFLQGWDFLIIKVIGFKDRSWKVNIKEDGSISSIEDYTHKPIIGKPQPCLAIGLCDKPPINCMAQFICPDGSSRTGCSYETVCKDTFKPNPKGEYCCRQFNENTGRIDYFWEKDKNCRVSDDVQCAGSCPSVVEQGYCSLPSYRDTVNIQQTALAEAQEELQKPKRPQGNGFTIIVRSQTLRNAIRAKGSMSFLSLLVLVKQIETEPKDAKLKLISKVQLLFKEYVGQRREDKPVQSEEQQRCIKNNGKWYDGINNCYPSSNPTALCTSGCYEDEKKK